MRTQNNKKVTEDNLIKRSLKNNKIIYSNILLLKNFLLKNKISKNRKGNIVMFHIGRVGSTVLADLINQNSNIHWDGECYIKKNQQTISQICKDPIKYISIKKNQFNTDFYGFEIKSTITQLNNKKQDVNMPIEEYISKLEEINFNYFILLKRKNYLKQYISFLRSGKQKIKHTTQQINKTEKIEVPIINTKIVGYMGGILSVFQQIDKHYINIEKKLQNKNTLYLTYEDDILYNPMVAYRKTCDFLKIEYQNPKVNLKRTNPFTLKEVIKNYSEVENALIDTKYEWMLY